MLALGPIGAPAQRQYAEMWRYGACSPARGDASVHAAPGTDTWLVSCNPTDVIDAFSAGFSVALHVPSPENERRQFQGEIVWHP
jgi:hypothetical protein